MSVISSINTTFFPELLEGFTPKSLQSIVAVGKDEPSQRLKSNSYPDYVIRDNEEIDFSKYFTDLDLSDWLTEAGKNVTISASELNNTITQAIANGYSAQDACKIKQAEIAYKANVRVFDAAEEMSTFLLET